MADPTRLILKDVLYSEWRAIMISTKGQGDLAEVVAERISHVVGRPEAFVSRVYRPVPRGDGRFACRMQIVEEGVDRPMVGEDSVDALQMAIRMVGVELSLTELYGHAPLYSGPGILGVGMPIWQPVKRSVPWPRSWAPPPSSHSSFHNGRYGGMGIATRLYCSTSPEPRTTIQLSLTAPAVSDDGSYCCKVSIIGSSVDCYEVSDCADSMEALELALLTASVRMDFLLERLGWKVTWGMGNAGTGLPGYPDLPLNIRTLAVR